jgi:hypothetical protein
MNTRLLMRASAAFLGLLGASATFLPQEILARAGAPPVGAGVVLVQIAGALYLGFALLNWMAQGNLIGGIYSRPVAVGNLGHFAIAGLSLLKAVLGGQRLPEIVVGTVAYLLFAVLFALVVFRHPAQSPPMRQTDAHGVERS